MTDRGGPFVAGMVVGAVIGAGLAVLLAPQSGAETRDVLRAKSREASNVARDATVDAVDGVRKTLESAITEAQSAERRRAELESHKVTGESIGY